MHHLLLNTARNFVSIPRLCIGTLQVKESLEESQALRENFENELACVRKDAERRLAEKARHAKKQQVYFY